MSAGFLRPIASFVCDTVVVFMAATFIMLAWSVHLAGVFPGTASEISAVLDKFDSVPDLLPPAVISYAIVSSTPLLGHRSVGMRLFGLQLIRAQL